jgi:hypothetical protein
MMAQLYFQHDAIPYIFDTKLLKLFRLEGSRSVEINNPDIVRNVRLYAAEISQEQALKMVEGCHN